MGILCSYTLEASYGGTNMGSRAYTHFNTKDYEGMGRSVVASLVIIIILLQRAPRRCWFRYFCETLLDFFDPCLGKEQLRAKIVNRLVKEGSTADEPANIALSDYSSLSSDDLSSNEDMADESTKGFQVSIDRDNVFCLAKTGY